MPAVGQMNINGNGNGSCEIPAVNSQNKCSALEIWLLLFVAKNGG
jgi:hypothetical protein